VVRVKLYKGNCTVVGRKSDSSLYHPDFATFEGDEVYRQKDAEGFIRLNGLRLKIARLLERARDSR
jgi:argininosuccinate synthase